MWLFSKLQEQNCTLQSESRKLQAEIEEKKIDSEKYRVGVHLTIIMWEIE